MKDVRCVLRQHWHDVHQVQPGPLRNLLQRKPRFIADCEELPRQHLQPVAVSASGSSGAASCSLGLPPGPVCTRLLIEDYEAQFNMSVPGAVHHRECPVAEQRLSLLLVHITAPVQSAERRGCT